MKEGQTKNKTRGFLGFFATLALTIGVGVVLTPKEAVETKAVVVQDTYKFSTKDWKTDSNSTDWIKGKEGTGFTANQGLQISTGASGAYGISPISYSNVSSIVIGYTTNASSGVGSLVVSTQSTTNGTATQVGSNFSITKPSSGGTTVKYTTNFVPSGTTVSGYINIKGNCTTNSIFINNVTITYDTIERNLESLTTSGAPTKTAYTEFDVFDPSGLSVWANYDNGDSELVTNDATFSPNPLTFGTTEIEIFYEGERTTYSPITVAKADFIDLEFIAADFDPAFTTDSGGSTYEKTTQHGIDFRAKGVRLNSGNYFMPGSSLLYSTSTIGTIKQITINAGAGTPGQNVTGKIYFSPTPFTDTLTNETGTYTNKNTTTFTAPAGSQYFAIGGISGGNLAFGKIEVRYDLFVYEDLSSFEIHGGNASLIDGETLALSIDVNEDANPAANWVSLNTNVATISGEGLVTAVAPGTTTITATSAVDPTFSDSIQLTVLPIVETSLTLNETSVMLKLSKTKQLIATILPANTSDKTIAWSSSDSAKVSVSNNGLVTALEITDDPVTITATSANGLTAIAEVTVVENLIQEGTYTLTADTTAYKDPLDPNLVKIEKNDVDLGDITISNINNTRLNSLPHATKTITIGRNSSEGGSFTITLGEGLIATSITFNGLIVDSEKTPILKINDGVRFQYSGKNSETLHPYTNELNISTEGTSRIWTTSIVIVAKRVENAAIDYANLFLSETAQECLDRNVLESTWDDLGDIYIGMDNAVIDQFENVVANAEGNSLEQFVARYTYIGEKYGYYDFIDLGLVNATNRTINKFTIDNLPLRATIMIGAIGLTTLAGYYFLRKRQEN